MISRLCGIATFTRRYVEQLAGSSARLYDTRKTTPGWRLLEKYAVRCGGGHNHRSGLYDGFLIKDNHLALAGDATGPLPAGDAAAKATALARLRGRTNDGTAQSSKSKWIRSTNFVMCCPSDLTLFCSTISRSMSSARRSPCE